MSRFFLPYSQDISQHGVNKPQRPVPLLPSFQHPGKAFTGTDGTTAAYVYVSGSGAMFVKETNNGIETTLLSHPTKQLLHQSRSAAARAPCSKPETHHRAVRDTLCVAVLSLILTSADCLPPPPTPPPPAHCSTSFCVACQRFTAGAEQCSGLYTHSCHTALWPVHLARLYNPPR